MPEEQAIQRRCMDVGEKLGATCQKFLPTFFVDITGGLFD